MSIALGASLSTLVPYRILLCIVAAVIASCSAYLATRQQPDIDRDAGLKTVPGAAEAAARARTVQQV